MAGKRKSDIRRARGLRLGEPRKFEGQECGIDYIADNLDDANDPLLMQVTIAIHDPLYWKKQKHLLGREILEMSVEERVTHLWQAADDKRYHASKDTVLLLSAWLSLGHAISEVVATLPGCIWFGSPLLGFKEVWVVGVNTAHTFRLDSE